MESESVTMLQRSAGADDGLRVRRPIGILLSRFPLITETFILREIEELERQGQPVVLIPMIQERPEVVHEEARRWEHRAVTTPFMSGAVLRAFGKAWLRKPRRMFQILFWIIGKTLLHPRILAKSLALFPKSVYLASLVRRMGVVHLHAHFATHPTTMAFIIASLTGISFSFTVHAHDIFVDRTLLREKIRAATFIRSISRFNKAFLENLYPRAGAGKIHVVRVGIEPERYRSEDESSPRSAVVRLLCIAAMKPYKGVPFLIEAADILRQEGVDFRLEIIGSGPLMSRVAQSVTAFDLEDRVRLCGVLPQDEVAEKIRDADIFVLPSIIAADGQMEGVPVALMEAMAAGKPVVSTSISGIPELVEHGTSGLLVDPANPRQLADALRRLIEDGELRERFAQKGREKVESEFDLREVVRQLLARLDHVNPQVDEITSVPQLDEDVVWGMRRAHNRRDSQVFEMMAAGRSGVREIVLKRQVSRAGESRSAEERANDELGLLRKLAPHFTTIESSGRDLGVPDVLGCDRTTATVAMEHAGNLTLEDSIRNARRHGGTAADHLEQQMVATGVWLRNFQKFEQGDGRGAVRDDAQEARQRLKGRAGSKLSSRHRKKVLERIASLEVQLETPPRSAVAHHGDFWPGNVFISENALRVIDFEGYRLALPARDVAWFLLHTGLYLSFRAPRLLELCQGRFLEGYGREVDPVELELSRIGVALLLLEKDTSGMPLLQRVLREMYLRRELMR